MTTTNNTPSPSLVDRVEQRASEIRHSDPEFTPDWPVAYRQALTEVLAEVLAYRNFGPTKGESREQLPWKFSDISSLPKVSTDNLDKIYGRPRAQSGVLAESGPVLEYSWQDNGVWSGWKACSPEMKVDIKRYIANGEAYELRTVFTHPSSDEKEAEIAKLRVAGKELAKDMEAIAAGGLKIPAREYAMHALHDYSAAITNSQGAGK